MDEIERDFQEQEHMILTIHYDPIVEENAEVAEIRAFVSKAAKELMRDFLSTKFVWFREMSPVM